MTAPDIREIWFSTQLMTDAEFRRTQRFMLIQPQLSEAAVRRQRWTWAPSWLRFWPVYESQRAVSARIHALLKEAGWYE